MKETFKQNYLSVQLSIYLWIYPSAYLFRFKFTRSEWPQTPLNKDNMPKSKNLHKMDVPNE